MKNKKEGAFNIQNIKFLPANRSGFELAISSLVVLVLAIFVLIALIFVFSSGEKKFFDTIKEFFISDVESVRKACENACLTGMEYDFCCRERSADFGNGIENITCQSEKLNIICLTNCDGVCSG